MRALSSFKQSSSLLFPFLLISVAVFIIVAARNQARTNSELYFIEDDEREVGALQMIANIPRDEDENNKDDDNNNNDNIESSTNNNYNSFEDDGVVVGVLEENTEDDDVVDDSQNVVISAFECPAGYLKNKYKNNKCIQMSKVSVYTPPVERLNVKIFPDLSASVFDAHKNSGCAKLATIRSYPETGFGAILNYAIYEYATAIRNRKQYDFPANSLLAFTKKSTCNEQSLSCYLLPLSNCGQILASVATHNFEKAGDRQMLEPHGASPSFFSYHASVAAHVWRPNDDFATKVARIKNKMGWPTSKSVDGTTPKVISVHVRKGDSCVAEGRVKKYGGCMSYSRYAKEVERIRNAYGKDIFKFVFLATDDERTVKEARNDAKKNRYTLLVAPVDRNWYNPKNWNADKYSKNMARRRRENEHFQLGFIERRLKAGDGDTGRVGFETATDVELLASGDAFVGTFTSNLGRLAFEIMSARLQKVPPFASVDGKGWYYGQSSCREKNTKAQCPVATWMSSPTSSSTGNGKRTTATTTAKKTSIMSKNPVTKSKTTTTTMSKKSTAASKSTAGKMQRYASQSKQSKRG